ncbi:M23 family metallopeptidase [Streptomyces sp. NPDC052236]|uniref:M23 family metallopeptidase n=1 Tax=Streptomyces sp. NPDC052236 TaxID=3365686 RepID=UPI0037D5F0DC
MYRALFRTVYRVAYRVAYRVPRGFVVSALLAALLLVGAGHAASATGWPVGPPRPVVVRGWEPPSSAYGPGHRGVDLAAPPGTPVRATGPGRVSFAAVVAGRGVLSLTLARTGEPPLRTTYEPVRPLLPVGAKAVAGQVVATVTAGPSHCGAGCLHWGLLRGSEYLDPLSLLPPQLLRHGPSRLLPVIGVPALATGAGAPVAAPLRAGAAGATHAALLLVTAAAAGRRLRRGMGEGERMRGCMGGGAGPPGVNPSRLAA